MNNQEIYQLDEHELDMLKESEDDIKHGRIISQEDLEWLSEV